MKTPSILKTKPVFMAMKPFAMVQYGPPRSGSTLVYNMMREIFPSKKIFKVHSFRKMCSFLTTVGTYRNPLDSIASSLLRYGIEKPTDGDVQKEIEVFYAAGFNKIPEMMNKNNILMLKYEDFIENHDYIFNSLEDFMDITIETEIKERLKSKYAKEKIKEHIDELKQSQQKDSKGQWHLNHISEYKGRPGYHREILTKKQIIMALDAFGDTMRLLGYATGRDTPHNNDTNNADGYNGKAI